VLYAPLLRTTYLIDNDGRVVHKWESTYGPSGSVYLLENGNLLRGAKEPGAPVFKGGGAGGRIQEFSWDGELLWDWTYATENHLLHHDIERLPNGNILAIAWEAKSAKDANQAGRRVELTPEAGLWPDHVIEIEPSARTAAASCRMAHGSPRGTTTRRRTTTPIRPAVPADRHQRRKSRRNRSRGT
jgi:hypothetical protein